jgi:hypothetical protein
MDEGTHTASDPCFKRYRGSVVVHGRRVDVQLQSRQNEPVICAVPGVGDWFVRMRLDRPLPSGAVVHAPPPFRRDGWKVFPYAALLGSHGPHFLTLEPPG